MIEAKLEKVPYPDHPNRCQGTIAAGQCQYMAIPGSKYCKMHGGNTAVEAIKAESVRQYNLAKWQSRVNHFAGNDAVKSLRDEIGISRMLLENILNLCKDEHDLLLYSGKIGELVTKIEKLVVACSRLESNMGMLLDRTAALQLSGQMVEIITKYVDDPDAVSNIANEIAVAIANINGAQEET